MSTSIFIGSKTELGRLKALYLKKAPSLVVIKGRRRIGKSRLVFEFASITKRQKSWIEENCNLTDMTNHYVSFIGMLCLT